MGSNADEQEKDYPFSDQEHVVVYKLLQRSQKLFCSADSDDDLYNHIMTSTLFDHRMEASISLKILSEGKLGWRTFPTFTCKQAFNAGRLRLERRGVIYTVSSSDGFSPLGHGFNLPGICGVWLQIAGGMTLRGWEVGSSSFDKIQGQIQDIRSKAVSWMEKHGRPIKEAFPVRGRRGMKGIEEFVKEGLRKSKEAQEKKSRKLKSKPQNEMSAHQVLDLLKQLCAEHGVRYIEPSVADAEKGRLMRSAKNLLSYYERDGKDLKVFLDEVVRFWPRFCNNLVPAGGGSLQIPSTVSLYNLFAYRKEIESWIELHREDKRRPVGNIIRLDSKTGRERRG